MRSPLRWVGVSIGAIVCLLGAAAVRAQTLTGATLYHAEENGSYSGREYWVTGKRCEGWYLFFRKESQWHNDVDNNIRISLAPGIHMLRFYADDGGPFLHASLSLYFDNEENTPDLCVTARVAQSELEKPPFAAAQGNALRTNHTVNPSPGKLVYEHGDVLVEVIDFRILNPSVEKVDLVNPYEPKPNTRNDYVGMLTLRVLKRHIEEVTAAGTQRTVPYKALTLTGHNGEVTSAVFSPDGNYLVTCGDSEDKTARVWSVASGRELFTFFDNPGVLAAQFSPDSKCVLASIGNNTARVWSVENGHVLFTLRGHSGPIVSMTYSPDGHQIVTGSYDGTARIWNAKTGQELLVLRGHRSAVLSVAFSRDGKRLVTAGQDKVVKIWELPGQGRRAGH